MFIYILLLLVEFLAILFLIFTVLFNFVSATIVALAVVIINGIFLVKSYKKNQKAIIPTIIAVCLTIVAGYLVVNAYIKVLEERQYKIDKVEIEIIKNEIDMLKEELSDLMDNYGEFMVITDFRNKSSIIDAYLIFLDVMSRKSSAEELRKGIKELDKTYQGEELNVKLLLQMILISNDYVRIAKILEKY